MLTQVVVALCILALRTHAQDEEEEDEWDNECAEGVDYYVTTLGNSGQFTYQQCNDSNWLKIKINSITEVDADGTKTNNKENSFSGGEWEFDDDDVYVQYTVDIDDGEFVLYTRVLNQSEVFNMNGTNNIRAKKGSLKWGFEVHGWQFLSEDNSLAVSINFDAKGGKGGGNDGSDEEDGGLVTTGFQGFEIVSPTFATLTEGGSGQVSADVSTELSGGDSKAEYTVTLENYPNGAVVDYDPVVEDDSEEDGDDDGGANMAGMGAAVVLAVFSLMIN